MSYFSNQLQDFLKKFDLNDNGKRDYTDKEIVALSLIGLEGTQAFSEKLKDHNLNESDFDNIKNNELQKGKCN